MIREGYIKRREERKFDILNSWRQTRFLAYMLAKPNLKNQNLSIYDFLPLEDDPTEDQIRAAMDEEINRDAKWQKSVIENFRKLKRKK